MPIKTPPIKIVGGTANVFPDPLADGSIGRNVYTFGFRNTTGLDANTVAGLKGEAQISAPLLFVDEEDKVTITLGNLGLQIRPDLVDSHTIHWHGFRNAIPLFDGVPEMSIAVPVSRDFTYFYFPHDPGTYMYHCHFEDVEHIHMGMTGVIFVRPAQNKLGGTNLSNTPISAIGYELLPLGTPKAAGYYPRGYAYNDNQPISIASAPNPLSSAYDREFTMFMSEIWAAAHYNDAHIQATDWSDYKSDFWLLNGRAYPDTTLPNLDPDVEYIDPPAPLVPPPSGKVYPPAGMRIEDALRLQSQPISSLVTANSGDRVLLRFVSLGYQQSSMTLPGIDMTIVGKDAVYQYSDSRESIGTGHPRLNAVSTVVTSNTIYFGPGESVDAIFIAPTYDVSLNSGTDALGRSYNSYLLYNRGLFQLSNGSDSGIGGQATEVRVYPSGTLLAQTAPNA
jgi:FtsP/CotA-like multicopper oxidase with cupredoxin domain